MGRVVRLSGTLLYLQFLAFIAVFFSPQFAHGGSGDGEPPFNGVSLSVASPTVPPGGILQMQVFVTEPKPILKGKQGVKSSRSAAAALTGNPTVVSPLGPVRDA